MTENNPAVREVDQFILEQIESVPHLEALLLLWNTRPKQWSLQEMAKALYLKSDATQSILQDLEQRGLAAAESDFYCYNPGFNRGKLLEEVDRSYRRELVRISRMIHSKASPAVREFARAFKFKKD